MQTRSMTKPISWFEIPTVDLTRAAAFYEHIFSIELQQGPMGPSLLAVFPYDRETATGGCLIQGPNYCPSIDGTVIYLNAGDSLDETLSRVEDAGGKVLLPKTALPPGMGVFNHIADTEGNRIGLHAMN